MAVQDKDDRNVELIAQVLDELNRSEVVHQPAAQPQSETELSDSARHPRKTSLERESMLRQLPVE